ncbi:hypothetical protein ERJ75_001253000 [Trypanosoma vivax]|nr:hypothetical protein ERJ75_001253000 [Trypanosoma vivax]
MERRPPTVVCCIALLLLGATGANCLYVLELVQVAHRSGVAPPPATVPGREKLCSPDSKSNCSAIANHGVLQMREVGAYIKNLYSRDADVNESSGWFDAPYDPTAVRTRAFADPSVLRAAAALLAGVYAGQDDLAVPAVLSAPPDDDMLLSVRALPSFALTNESRAADIGAAMAKAVSEQFPDAAVIRRMAEEVGLGEACADAGSHAWCCHRLQSLTTTYAAVGGGGGAPTVMKHREQLDAVAGARARELYGRGAAGNARASFGVPLARELLQNMRRKMLHADDRNYEGHRVVQYAHDVPLHTALGHEPADTVPLAETFLLDLLRHAETGVYFVRLRYAAVDAAPDAAPTLRTFPFRCLDAAQQATDATVPDGVVCPFDDYVRFVEGRGGDDVACHLDDATSERLKCSSGGAPPSPDCARYRALCPAHACPSGYVYDSVDGSCKARVVQKNIVNTSAVAGLLCLFLLFGFLASVFIFHWCPGFTCCCSKKVGSNV